MRKADNTRRLCARCRADYRDAGYEPRKIWTKYREPCDYAPAQRGCTR